MLPRMCGNEPSASPTQAELKARRASRGRPAACCGLCGCWHGRKMVLAVGAIRQSMHSIVQSALQEAPVCLILLALGGRGCGRRTSFNTDRMDPVKKPAPAPTATALNMRLVLRNPHSNSIQSPPAHAHHPGSPPPPPSPPP